ncbi:MAG: GAF domain-containing protein [Ruminococcus sp.]|nr:GAF domain-containing protein [Ruminococcus sp.]
MHTNPITYPTKKKELYKLLKAQLSALTENIPHLISNLSNASALLGSALKDINWVGFYLIPSSLPEYFPLDKIAGKENLLVLGPFQGLPACIEIAIGKGVCGTAVAKDSVMLVPNVHEFPGHIACDSASNSEIVLPIHTSDGKIAGVLDIDSPLLGRFDEEDQKGLEEIVRVIERFLK